MKNSGERYWQERHTPEGDIMFDHVGFYTEDEFPPTEEISEVEVVEDKKEE